MSNIEQILSRCDLQKEDDESLASIRMHSEGAYEGIMSGLGPLVMLCSGPVIIKITPTIWRVMICIVWVKC
ncbi:Uncharacterised protein [Salmonella enterica subsp. enterica]|uniref:Uncharacterized protein n=1 Tax=Salmonella enterica I TaxID=59201 RepID=A0A379V4P6_SALET|nr:Uncharacterised protein [Salmonella enterica subsp. enterica]